MTQAIIRPATAKDIEPVCRLLHEKMNSKIALERWQRLMRYQWLMDKPDLGRVVEYQAKVLGYLGLVYADRVFAGKAHRTVNVCTWYLDKTLRGMGLGKGIMQDATGHDDYVYTINTSSKKTVQLLYQVGFKDLDVDQLIWQQNDSASDDLKRITEIEQIVSMCSDENKILLEDHLNLPVTPFWFEYRGESCLLIFSIKRKADDVLFYDVLFTDNRKFLAQNGQLLANYLLSEPHSVLAADRRFVEQVNVTNAKVRTLPVPRFFKSSQSIAHECLDHLYSELQLLDLKLD